MRSCLSASQRSSLDGRGHARRLDATSTQPLPAVRARLRQLRPSDWSVRDGRDGVGVGGGRVVHALVRANSDQVVTANRGPQGIGEVRVSPRHRGQGRSRRRARGSRVSDGRKWRVWCFASELESDGRIMAGHQCDVGDDTQAHRVMPMTKSKISFVGAGEQEVSAGDENERRHEAADRRTRRRVANVREQMVAMRCPWGLQGRVPRSAHLADARSTQSSIVRGSGLGPDASLDMVASMHGKRGQGAGH